MKTAVRLKVESLGELSRETVSDVAASAQEAIVDILAEKSYRAVKETGVKHFYLAGGVAANMRLREAITKRLKGTGVDISWPRLEFCTDNAAMIACAAYHHIESGHTHGLELNSFPRGDVESWRR